MGVGVDIVHCKDTAYEHLQNLLAKDIVIVVGSGASCALGLPSMGQLAARLIDSVPDRGAIALTDEWGRIATALEGGAGLEDTLGAESHSQDLIDVITAIVGEYVAESEAEAIAKILGSDEITAFGRLFKRLSLVSDRFEVVTTNYDRLVEVHAARAGVAVDTMFSGHTVGYLDEIASQEELMQFQPRAGARKALVAPRPRPHLRLAKPHGSLNWFMRGEEPFRSDIPIPGARRIIAPGVDKYQLGYQRPFDVHRTRANDAISNASGILFVGYGFNDSHLETYFSKLPGRPPSAVIAKSLTPNAREYLRQAPASTIGVEADGDEHGCIIWRGDESVHVDVPLWDFECLTREGFNL